MRNTFKVRFYCRQSRKRSDGTAPVECSIIVNGERQLFSLPRDCRPDDFPTADLDIYCTGIKNRINSLYTARSVAGEPITAFALKDELINGAEGKSYTLHRMFEDGLKLKVAQNTEPSTYRKYELVRDAFYEFTGFAAGREAGSVTSADIQKVQAGILRKFKTATTEKMMMRLKYFFLLAFNSGKVRSNPFATVKVQRAKPENVYLTPDELQAIKDAEITDDRYDRARDIFLFMAQTGLEYADMKELKAEDIKQYGNLRYIQKKRVKTGIEYISVLQGNAYEILMDYGGHIPLYSCQKLNLYIKEVAKIAKITDKNVSTLTARHTYATTLVNSGLRMDIVSKMLGHTNDRQTRVYAELLDNSVLEANEAIKGSAVPENAMTSQNRPKSGKKQKIEPIPEDWEDELEFFSEKLGLKG